MNRWFLKQISALNAADDYNTKKDEAKDGGGNTNTAQYKLTFLFRRYEKGKVFATTETGQRYHMYHCTLIQLKILQTTFSN